VREAAISYMDQSTPLVDGRSKGYSIGLVLVISAIQCTMRRSLIERQLSCRSSCYLHQFIIFQIKDLAEERVKQVLQDFQAEMSELTMNVLADSAARVRILMSLLFIA
jgi:putative ribosome biogenesis GTPase RsgA